MRSTHAAIGAGVLALGGLLAIGAFTIKSDAGYSGVGPAFLAFVVSVMLAVCGGFLLWEAFTGGFRRMEEPSGAGRGDWQGFAWVSAGILLNAALITTLGFILSCTLCFVLAVQGFRHSQGRLDLGPKAWIGSALIGFAIAAPVYWMFTKLLGINLPGITSTGWI